MAVIVGGPIDNTQLVDRANQSNIIIGDVNGTLDGVGGNDRIFAREGDDVVIGDALDIGQSSRGGNDLVYGGAGFDSIYGDARLTLRGLGGNDTLFAGPGGAGRQVMYGDAFALLGGAHGGNDRLVGGDEVSGDAASLTHAVGGRDLVDARDVISGGDVRLYGDALGRMNNGSQGGNDILYASSLGSNLIGDAISIRDTSIGGDDQLYGGSGNDLGFGDARHNLLAAAVGGNDILRGHAGNDELFGDALRLKTMSRGGDDDLYGGTGDDRLWGDGMLFGSAVGGEDRFHFGGSFGDDRILDFRHGKDTLIFDDLIRADIDPHVVGSNTVISTFAGDSVTILGYTGPLAGDIVFS